MMTLASALKTITGKTAHFELMEAVGPYLKSMTRVDKMRVLHCDDPIQEVTDALIDMVTARGWEAQGLGKSGKGGITINGCYWGPPKQTATPAKLKPNPATTRDTEQELTRHLTLGIGPGGVSVEGSEGLLLEIGRLTAEIHRLTVKRDDMLREYNEL